MIGLQKNEAHRPSGKCQDVTAENSGVRKSSVFKLRAEAKTSRYENALAINLGDPDKDVGRIVFEFYDGGVPTVK